MTTRQETIDIAARTIRMYHRSIGLPATTSISAADLLGYHGELLDGPAWTTEQISVLENTSRKNLASAINKVNREAF